MTAKEHALSEAGKAGKLVAFDYFKQTPTERADVYERRVMLPDPDEAIRENADGRRYVIGHDEARDEARSFHTDRISRVSVSPEGS